MIPHRATMIGIVNTQEYGMMEMQKYKHKCKSACHTKKWAWAAKHVKG